MSLSLYQSSLISDYKDPLHSSRTYGEGLFVVINDLVLILDTGSKLNEIKMVHRYSYTFTIRRLEIFRR